jgi:hypothetical protein
VQCTCGISWERDLLIDPAAVGANAARSQFRLRYGTREVDGAMRRETTSGGTTRRNINAPFSDGATGTSVEASVMDVEQSGGIVRRDRLQRMHQHVRRIVCSTVDGRDVVRRPGVTGAFAVIAKWSYGIAIAVLVPQLLMAARHTLQPATKSDNALGDP